MHWKNNIAEADHDAFRTGLYAAAGLSADEWNDYRENLKRYRDEHAAHFDLAKFEPGELTYPQYDKALEACYYYYERILEKFEQAGIQHTFPADIRDWCANFQECEIGIASAAIEATRELEETTR